MPSQGSACRRVDNRDSLSVKGAANAIQDRLLRKNRAGFCNRVGGALVMNRGKFFNLSWGRPLRLWIRAYLNA